MTDSRVLAIIPARGGSKGLRRKNLCPIAGKPMVAYSIEAANHCSLVTRTMVTTDDEEIADVARDYGADVPFMRPQELATDLTPTEPVLQHALAYVETEEREQVDVVLFLQPTDIFRLDGILNKVIQPLLDNPALDTCFPGFPTHKNYWRKGKDGVWFKLADDIAYGPRQTREHLYREDTGIACASRSHVIRAGRRVGDRVEVVAYSELATFIDVEDDFTLWLAEKAVSEWKFPVNE